MNKRGVYRLVGGAFLFLLVGSNSVLLAADFYAGKRIRIVVGSSPGGGFDTYARLIARPLGKHIPGQPKVLVQNMPGAGQLIAANYIFNRAKPDGLTIGHWSGALILQHVLGNPAVKVDGRKIGWLGAPVPDNGVCVFTRSSGIHSRKDWVEAKKPANLGGSAPGGATSDTPRIIKVAINPPMLLTEGYKGTALVRLAMASGEMDGLCGWGWASVKGTAYDKIQSGELKVVLQATLKRHAELPDVPLAIDYAKDERSRKFLEVAAHIHGTLERVYSVPPGVPAERVRLLQKAFVETLNDPELLREAERAKLEIRPIAGPAVAEAVNSLYQLSPALLTELRELLMPKQK